MEGPGVKPGPFSLPLDNRRLRPYFSEIIPEVENS